MIAVLDFGSQYTHLITRRVRELGVKAEIFEHDIGEQVLENNNVEGIILSGGPASVFEKNAPIAAFGNLDKNIFGVQFHPEVAHTLKGMKILENFLFKICQAKKTWKIEDVKKRLIKDLKKEIGDKKVMIGVSGGVDSTVAAQLLHKAIGNKLTCVFIDTGLLRKNETGEVISLFKKLGFKNFQKVSGENKFLAALKGVVDPEEKRKIFAKVYFQVFIDTAKRLEKRYRFEFLAQGTIYPDRVESGKTSKTSSLIKSHHNLSVPQTLGLKILEPLKDFYKDEVRELGKSLGISEQIIGRHPFPGPGLAIRILGEITNDSIKILQEADAIFIEELKNYGYYDKVWQAFAALLPVKSVGVMGDERTYDFIVALRAVTSRDAMTADWANLPPQLLKKVSSRIVNQVKGINRVVYDISQKPPATIEYE